jgi:fatty acid-binding protein DegV
VSALEAAYDRSDLVIALHVSATLSSTVTRANEAAERLGSRVIVIDTRSLSVGAGLVVSAVHRSAFGPNRSLSPASFARSLPERLHTFAVVQDVESLRRSDRASLLPRSHLARSHPLVLAVRGRVVALAQPKQRRAAIDELVRHLTRSTDGELGAWAFGHGDATDEHEIIERISTALGMAPQFFTKIDPIVGAHLGPESLVVGAIKGPVDFES